MLIKSGTALERLAQVDTVVFDKTGTLTMGTPEPLGLEALPPEALSVLAALARASSHPLAQALAARTDTPAEVSALREVPGYGVEGLYHGQTVRLGRAEWVGAAPLALTATYLSLGGQTHAVAFADQIRPFVPNRRFVALGTDGFGQSDTREALREFFEVDRHFIVLAALKALADDGLIGREKISEAISRYGINVDKTNPVAV